jgi:DNA-binding XRE family transcriptional regulator
MGFLLSKARLDGQFFLARLSAPRGPLHLGVVFHASGCQFVVTVLRQRNRRRNVNENRNGVTKLNAVQSKMARAALGLGVRDLAELAKVSPDTIARLEHGEILRERTIDAIRAAFEAAGVEFTNGEQPGVRLRKG